MTRLLLALMPLAVCMAPLCAAPPVIQTVLEVGKSGLPAQITAPSLKTPPLLAGPMTLALTEGKDALALPPLAAAEPNVFELPQPVAGLALSLRYGGDRYPFVEITVGDTRAPGTGAPTRRVTVSLTMSLPPQADQVFFPATDRAHEPLTPGDKPREYGYAHGGIQTALPLGQLYSAKQDWGLAFFQELGLLVEPWRVTLSRAQVSAPTEVTIALPLTVASGQGARRRVYFAATQGDWRPALGAVLAQFPQAFVPPHPEAVGLDGPFVCSGGTPPDERLADWRGQGCNVVEIHATFPFYGDYVPTREMWTPLIDDTWHNLRATIPEGERPAESDWRGIVAAVEQKHPPAMTAAKVRDYIERLHAHGMKGLIYYNPTEAWIPWAEEHFHGDMRFDAQGKPLPTWYESSCMVPDVTRPWGKHMIEQIKGELAAYPKLDGVFFDQSASGGHDLTVLCHEASEIVRARGGLCWWNGPYNMELAALADGMMTEGGGSSTYRSLTDISQYYGLAGKSCVSLGAATPAGYAEMLSRGVQPQPVGGSYDDLKQRWSPLFRTLRGRQWVLEAHALDPVPGFESNIYRVTDGNVAVTLVPERVWQEEPAVAYDVPVTVRLPEASAIKAAYLLAPDWRGYHKLALLRRGNVLTFTVPRVKWAGLVVLAKTGVFPAVEGPLHVVRGQKTQARYIVDNWTAQPVSADLLVKSGAVETRVQGQARPGASVGAALELPASEAATLVLDATGKLSSGDLPPVAELAVEPPVALMLSAPERVLDDETADLRIAVLSHLPAGTKLALSLQSRVVRLGGRDHERSLSAFTPRAESLTLCDVPLEAIRAGEGLIAVTARRGEDVVARAERPLRVVATALGPEALGHIQSAVLEFEIFGADGGGYAHKPVSLNGVVIGDPPTGSGDSWHPATLALPADALKAIAEHNEITIDNKVGDAFKVRNFRLLLTMRGGILAVSQTDAGTYTGWTDWLYGEGKQFAAGEPMAGIRVDLRIDPSRREKYEWFFGTPQSGKLVLEAFGVDGGVYAHKPISVNGAVIGDLPSAGSPWTEISLPLTADALAQLQTRNAVRIENSKPIDAFKVRRLRLEIVNTAGKAWTTETDEGPYTSCGWDFAEGKVGSPISSDLVFREGIE